MPDIGVRMRGGGLDAFRRYAERLHKRSLKTIERAACKSFANHAAKLVRRAYRGASYAVSPRTSERYTNPPPGDAPVSAKGSLRSTGQMVRSVVVHALAGRKGYQARIHPNAKYPSGKLVAQVAAAMEFGYTHLQRMTKKRLAYLHVLRQIAGDPRPMRLKLGQTIKIDKPARPIWGPVHKSLRSQREAYLRIVDKLLKKEADRAKAESDGRGI